MVIESPPASAGSLNVEALAPFRLTRAQTDELSDVYRRALREYLPDPGMLVAQSASKPPFSVVGVAVGTAKSDSNPFPAIKILVKRRLDRQRLQSFGRAPPELNGIPMDIEVVGELHAQPVRKRHRPAPGGVSVSHATVAEAGTIGCIVRDGKKLFLLSNNHVLALSNMAPQASSIVQPGCMDGGSPANDEIARLTRFVPIDPLASNDVDAAIAEVMDPAAITGNVMRYGQLVKLSAPEVTPQVGMRVQKCGRTTNCTQGIIRFISATVQVTIPLLGKVEFRDQALIYGDKGAFSCPGDSGALVTTEDSNQPVGLLFAGNTGYSVCSPITNVLNKLGVSILY